MKLFTSKYKNRILSKIADLEAEKASIRFNYMEHSLRIKAPDKYYALLLEEAEVDLQIRLLKSLL